MTGITLVFISVMLNIKKNDDEFYIMLYDMHPEGPGQARFFPRFYKENPWEFQCGTGTIVTGIGMAAS